MISRLRIYLATRRLQRMVETERPPAPAKANIRTSSSVRWGLLSDTTNQLDGRRVHLVYDNCLPVIFCTRREAREYANKRWGYIKQRPDLRREPHCCRMPKAVRVHLVADYSA